MPVYIKMVYGYIKLIYILIRSLPDKHHILYIVLFDFLWKVCIGGKYKLIMAQVADIIKEMFLLREHNTLSRNSSKDSEM